ncbi:MAG TPA: hypothetical protein VFP08_00005, partial [Acidimicrobiales bacterium]|nr:hypothetical protein [Acidimicrobiales bacterium]
MEHLGGAEAIGEVVAQTTAVTGRIVAPVAHEDRHAGILRLAMIDDKAYDITMRRYRSERLTPSSIKRTSVEPGHEIVRREGPDAFGVAGDIVLGEKVAPLSADALVEEARGIEPLLPAPARDREVGLPAHRRERGRLDQARPSGLGHLDPEPQRQRPHLPFEVV